MPRKKFEELNLTDAFLFAAAMSSPQVLKDTLEILLDREIDSITVKVEHSLLFSSDSRSVRLDVLSLKPGEDFDNLKPNYVIFICNFDPFGKGLYKYTFENICLENGMPLEDGTHKIFFNIMGKNREGVSEELVNLLTYMRNTSNECVSMFGADSRISRIHKHIEELRKSREWERCYMRFDELIRKAEKDAHSQGVDEGQKVGTQDALELVSRMLEVGETPEVIKRLSEDEEFLEEMRKKYLGTKE